MTDVQKPTSNAWWTRNNSKLTAFLRIAFGLVWVIDGLMKFLMMAPSDVTDLVQTAGQGQPAWLTGWFSFWVWLVSANPSFILYLVGALELMLGVALVLGLLRKVAYGGGIVLSLVIWSVDEGFGGPYGPGSTDIGAAIIYVFVFFALLLIDTSNLSSRYSLDTIIEHRRK